MKRSRLFGGLAIILTGLMVACPAPVVQSGPKVTVQNTVNGFQVAKNTGATFYATVENATDQRVSWSIDDPTPAKGSIAQNGAYTAPATVPSPANIRIRATSIATPALSGFLEITIVNEGGIAGEINIPAGLLSAPSNVSAQAADVDAPKVAGPDWSAPRVRKQFLMIGSDSSSVVRAQSASISLQRAKVTSVGGSLLRVEVPTGEDDAAFAARVARETGARVQPIYVYKALDVPNDEYFAQQTNLTQIDVQGAWSVQTGLSSDNLIAVLDTGANFGHPDLNGRLNNGTDFCSKLKETPIVLDGKPDYDYTCDGTDNDSSDIPLGRDSGNHGTHAAGLIAANTNNTTGIAGITRAGRVLVVKVLGNTAPNTGSGADVSVTDSLALSKGIRYAVDAGAKVISMSLGVPFKNKGIGKFDEVVKAQLDYAAGKGVMMVAAAGNVAASNDPAKPADFSVFFPASDENVLAVGAVDGNNNRASYSAYQNKADLIFAPGNNVLSTYGNAYGQLSGTSFAAPQVAAVAGLMLSQRSSLTRAQITQFLKETAKPLGAGLGVGLLQAGAALRKAQNPASEAISTTIYVYADPRKGGACATNTDTSNDACYDGDGPQTGRSVVTFTSKSGAVNYSVTINRAGQNLTAGTYRIVACVNKNSNDRACDVGDLFVRGSANVVYDGTTNRGNNVTLALRTTL